MVGISILCFIAWGWIDLLVMVEHRTKFSSSLVMKYDVSITGCAMWCSVTCLNQESRSYSARIARSTYAVFMVIFLMFFPPDFVAASCKF